MKNSIWNLTDGWLSGDGPQVSVVVSCRARFARNLAGLPFPPRSNKLALKRVADSVREAIDQCEEIKDFYCLTIDGFSEQDRQRLRESHLISQEMERGGEYRLVFFGAEPIPTTLMVNEEDHLRIFAILPGLQIEKVLERLITVDDRLMENLTFAFSERFGFLTACPTNTGTGLRVSAMLHLPALALTGQTEEIMDSISNRGMAVRGYYGENSAHTGDFYQISNETTLGETEEQIARRLKELINGLAKRENEARDMLFQQKRTLMEDKIYRSLSVLASSRIINTQEAVETLSLLRLGIDRGFLPGLTHGALNRLIVRVQPGHLQHERGEALDAEKRDVARATLLRDTFSDISHSAN